MDHPLSEEDLLNETQLKFDLRVKQEREMLNNERALLNKEREELRQLKIDLLQNNILIKKQYEALKLKYKTNVESLMMVKVTENIRTIDERDENTRYLQQLAQTELTPDNEEEFQNVYGMINGLTVIIGCSFNYPIEAPIVKILANCRLFHPNIGENGMMKFSLINRDWCIGITLIKLVEAVKEILAIPDLNTIVNKEASLLYISNKTEYYRRLVIGVIEINSSIQAKNQQTIQ